MAPVWVASALVWCTSSRCAARYSCTICFRISHQDACFHLVCNEEDRECMSLPQRWRGIGKDSLP